MFKLLMGKPWIYKLWVVSFVFSLWDCCFINIKFFTCFRNLAAAEGEWFYEFRLLMTNDVYLVNFSARSESITWVFVLWNPDFAFLPTGLYDL